MAITQIKGSNIEDGTIVAADVKDDSITNAKIKSDAAIAMTKLAVDPTDASNITSGTLPTARLASVLDLSGKTVTLPAASVTAHATTPTLDSPVITGTLTLLPSAAVTHTIANWSDDLSYTITPTNCTVGDVNVSGQFVVTHTSGIPSYTIKATTASLGLADSALVTKNITITLTAPTLSSPADVGTAADVVYTITSTDSNDDKLILDPGTANFTYQSESGPGTASKVGNTVECVGFGTGNPVVTIQFTAEATYSVTAKAVKIDGTYGTSANSAADSIVIENWTGLATNEASQTGVTITTDGDYKYHVFNQAGDFIVTTLGHGEIEYLVLAGGGSGASGYYGGGGGGGGYRTATGFSLPSASTYAITVGAGGATGSNDVTGANGVNSVFDTAGVGTTITATYGGAGCGYNSGQVPNAGGSGGGGTAGSGQSAGAAGNLGSFDPVEGYAGGSAIGDRAAGGGGAGSVGEDSAGSSSAATGGDGGAGTSSSITGAAVIRGGGGGGGAWYHQTTVGLAGNLDGYGNGGYHLAAATAGANNKGNGGGGGQHAASGGGLTGSSGGSGVVIIRYKFQ